MSLHQVRISQRRVYFAAYKHASSIYFRYWSPKPIARILFVEPRKWMSRKYIFNKTAKCVGPSVPILSQLFLPKTLTLRWELVISLHLVEWKLFKQSILMINQWGTSAKKKKKKLPQNKPSRDESSLPRCNMSSVDGRIGRPWLICKLSRFKEKKQQQKNTYNITTAKKCALHCWWTVLKPSCSLDRLIQPWTRYYTGVGRARHGSVCFEATSFFLFGGSPSFVAFLK